MLFVCNMSQQRTWLVILILGLCGFLVWRVLGSESNTLQDHGAIVLPTARTTLGGSREVDLVRTELNTPEEPSHDEKAGSGLDFWQNHYRNRLADGSVWISEKDDWWFEDQEVMQAFQGELASQLKCLQDAIDQRDFKPKPWTFPGLEAESLASEAPLGVVFTLDNCDIPFLGHYEMSLVATELRHLAVARKAYGLTPFAAERPLISLAEMDSNPFSFPVEYFLQAYSGADTRTDWPAEILESSRRAWSDFAAEYAMVRREVLVREAAISNAASKLAILKPHPAYFDLFLPGTSELNRQIGVVESAYLQSLRRVASSLVTAR